MTDKSENNPRGLTRRSVLGTTAAQQQPGPPAL